MTLSLSKGNRVNLQKESPGLNHLRLGLGWDARVTDGADFDADVSILMLDGNSKAIDQEHFVFYGKLASDCGSIIHHGDNRTGEGDGDDEEMDIIFDKVPANVEKLLVAVTIHDADIHGQNFGQIDNAFVRMTNVDTNKEITRYDLTEDFSTETCVIFAEVYKKDGDWRVLAKGEGFAGGLAKFLHSYGIDTNG